MSYVKDLGYTGGNTPQDETILKHYKCLIDTRLVMDVFTREEKNIIFGKSQKPLAFPPSN